MELLDQYREIKEFYDKKGIFGGRCGFGERPAIVVIDLARGWTDPESPLGSELLADTVANTVKILSVARQTKPKIPIFFTTMAFDPSLKDMSQARTKKRKGTMNLIVGSKWVELHPALKRQPDELLYPKRHASAFFGTTFLEQLIDAQRDTLIITGCSITGCVYATSQDSMDYGFHTILPLEAVGDRNPELAKWMLINIDLRWGDVIPMQTVLDYLRKFC